MSLVTRALHLTDRQIRILCEGMKLLKVNPASLDEHATAERLLQHFESVLAAKVDAAFQEPQPPVAGDAAPATKAQLLDRVSMLSDEMDANDEENRAMQSEIDGLYAQIDAMKDDQFVSPGAAS